jgi:hypothetical protein
MSSLKGTVNTNNKQGKVRCNMAKKNNNRGAKVGVPHITNKVLQMDEKGREAWLTEKCGTDEIRNEVRTRLNDILANGRPSKDKPIDYASLFAGRSYDELQTAEKFLQTAKQNAKQEEIKKLHEETELLKARLASLT